MACYQLAPRGDAHQTLLGHFPLGEAWHAVRIAGKNLYRLITAFAQSYEDMSKALCRLATELNPYATTELITEWETSVGLPDACLPSATTLQERRDQVVFRLTKRRWSTEQDYHDIAALFGLELRITPGWEVQEQSLYPMCYPLTYWNLPRLGRFHIFIDIFGGCGEAGYIYDYPIVYGPGVRCETFMCLIERVKPANVVIVWNEWPEICGCNDVTFSDDFSEEFC